MVRTVVPASARPDPAVQPPVYFQRGHVSRTDVNVEPWVERFIYGGGNDGRVRKTGVGLGGGGQEQELTYLRPAGHYGVNGLHDSGR